MRGKHAKRSGLEPAAGFPDDATAWEYASAGTYVDRALPRGFSWVAVVLALVAILLPSIGMAWAYTDSTTENRELAAAPALTDADGSPNVDVMSDWGTWFEDHFAYRNQLVAANARLEAGLGASPTDQVVVGTDGWLYYGGTLPDYLGQNGLSDRALASIAHNLSLVQGYVQARGGSFVFAVAPNKNTLYPEHMPYYYLASPEAGNLERLAPYLDAAGVSYLDLRGLLAADADATYLKTDSHWDNRTALLAANALMEAVGHDALDVDAGTFELRDDFLGDLETMLYPDGAQTETNQRYAGINDGEGWTGSSWRYVQGSAVTDDWVQTAATGGSGEGSLLVFRDSFGNATLPFLAASYGQAAFSKLIPYNVPVVDQVGADTVIIERAERHLPYLAQAAPILPNPKVSLKGDLPMAYETGPDTTLSVSTDGSYWVLSGELDPRDRSVDDRVYVAVLPPESDSSQASVYDAFWTSSDEVDSRFSDTEGDSGDSVAAVTPGSDYGYRLYLNAQATKDGATLSTLEDEKTLAAQAAAGEDAVEEGNAEVADPVVEDEPVYEEPVYEEPAVTYEAAPEPVAQAAPAQSGEQCVEGGVVLR